MIKRPLWWTLIGFVLGEFLHWFNETIVVFSLVFIVIVIFLVIYILKKYHVFYSQDYFILLLPIFIYLGFVLMKNQQEVHILENFFDDKIPATITGQVYKTEEKTSVWAVYIKDCTIVVDIENESQKYFCKKILIYTSCEERFKNGNKIIANGKLNKFQKPGNPGQFNENIFYKTQNISYKLMAEDIHIIDQGYNKFEDFLERIKYHMMDSYDMLLNEKNSGIIKAMVLGYKTDLSEEIKDLYQKNGIIHILAISGSNVALIGMALFVVCSKVGMKMNISLFLSIIVVFCYGQLTGFSISSYRAVVMLIVAFIAKSLGRTYDTMSAVALSSLIILIQEPMQIYDAGFLLSYGAVLGIAFLVPLFNNLITKKNFLLDVLLVNVAVNIMTTPVILFYYFEIPTYSLFLNLLVVPLMSLLVPIGLIGGLLGCFYTNAGVFLIGGAHYILELYEMACELFESLPFSMIVVGKPSLLIIFLYYLVLLVFALLLNRFNNKYILLILCFLSMIFIKPYNKGLDITFIDVGQGDGIFIKTKKNAYLVDGGSSQVKQLAKYRIVPFIKSKGVGKLDGVIITHLDADHISGIVEMIQLIDIDTIILPITNLVDDTYLEMINLAKGKGINVEFIKKGDIIHDDDVVMKCLHPYEGFTAKSKNEYSTVLSLELGSFKALLTGDLEEGQEKLIEPLLGRYFILKVAHHGSKTSTSEGFLDMVKPYVSIISCGKNNIYKHPNQAVVDRLIKYDSMILGTNEDGAIMVNTNGKNVNIKTYISKKNIYAQY